MRGRVGPSRRAVLRAALVAPVVPAAASCTSTPPPPPPPDPLAELAARARADAASASAIAAAVPGLAAAAREVAKVRSEHALALQREVDRERPPRGSTSPPVPETSVAAPPADAGAAKAAMVAALTAAEQRMGELIASVPRYRAGLLGSVAGGCASLREVLA